METTISNVLQQTISGKPNNGPLSKAFKPSERQETEAQRFRDLFPSEDKAVAYFAPAKWAAASTNPSRCTMLPSVTLAMVNWIYGKEVVKSIVVNNIVGLFTIAKPREPLYTEAIELTARLFVGKFGTQLSIFGMLLFFADYLTEYKSSYGQFDLPDVLRSCGKAFLPRWRNRLGRQEQRENSKEGFEEVGKAALYRYLRREYVSKGKDIRKAPVVALGCLSEKELKFIESNEELPL